MILSLQSRDNNSEELLPGSLHVSCERGAHGGSNHDGEAIGQQLKQKKTDGTGESQPARYVKCEGVLK